MTPRLRYGLDLAIVILIASAVLINLTGGFYVMPFGVRLSATRPDRPFALALVLVAVRWLVWRREDFLGRPTAMYGRLWARVFDRHADEVSGAAPGARAFAAATLGLIVAGAILLQAQLSQMYSVPDYGDPLFSIWRMNWVYQQWLGDPRGLFDANILHPAPLTLTLSDAILLPSVMAAPFFAAGLHPVVVYHVVLLSAFLLSGLATYALAARLTGSAPAAFIAAVFYGYHPYRFEHYSHLELQMTWAMPLALLALMRLVETGRARYAIAAALLAAAQLYSAMYYGVFFPIYALAVIGVLLWVRRQDWRPLLRPALAGGAIAAALATPLARPYLAAEAMKGERQPFEVAFYSADPLDYLRPHPRSATWFGRLPGGAVPERALFPGAVPVMLSAVALAPPVGPVRMAFTAGLIVAYDMSRGMKGILYPTLYKIFPPLRGLRVAARFSIILGISLAVLAAFGARRLLLAVPSPAARRLVFVGLTGVLLLDVRPSLTLLPVWREPPRIYQDLPKEAGVVLAEFPVRQGDPTITDEVPYMYFSLWHWRQMVNGYSGFELTDHEELLRDVRGFPDDESIAALRSRGVTHVTVNCAFIGDFCGDLLAKVDARPEFRLMRIAHWQMRPTRLYELTK